MTGFSPPWLVLVNNAGIAGPTGGVEEISVADWCRTIDVNLTGQFLCAHDAFPLLRQAGTASMINLSSAAGRFGYAYRSPYSASKWAVFGFTQSLAKELGPDGIRVNAILPGIVEGPRMDNVIGARAEQIGVSLEAMRKTDVERISLRRMTPPDEVRRPSSSFVRRPVWAFPASRSASAATSSHSDQKIAMATQCSVIISCAITGAIHTPSMSPHLPVTAEEIARSALPFVQALLDGGVGERLPGHPGAAHRHSAAANRARRVRLG